MATATQIPAKHLFEDFFDRIGQLSASELSCHNLPFRIEKMIIGMPSKPYRFIGVMPALIN